MDQDASDLNRAAIRTHRVETASRGEAGAAEPNQKRWLILAVIAATQLMIVVDASIVNIALPHAQAALHISNDSRQWVVTSYTLSFGGLLLLGGRISDYAGPSGVLVLGQLGFAGASAVAGLAPNSAVLFTARAVQGAFAALMAPAALALLSKTFTDPKERARAFGVYGGIGGGGLAIGLIAGGVLTQFASWRWCLLVNVPIALITAFAASRLLVSEAPSRHRGGYDVPGAITSTLGIVCLVYGLTKASTDGWGSSSTVGLLALSGLLLASFLLIERRSRFPLLPLRVITERNRRGAFLASALIGVALFGASLFLTYYLQGESTLDYSPLHTGFAFLPFSLGVVIGAALASFLLSRLAPRLVMAGGFVMASGGMIWFTQLSSHAGYWPHIFPGEVALSVGMGLVFVPVAGTALVGTTRNDSGVASAMVNTSQQVGGSIGVALLNTIAVSTTSSYIATHGLTSAATGLVRGYDAAFLTGALVLIVAAVVTLVLVNTKSINLMGPLR